MTSMQTITTGEIATSRPQRPQEMAREILTQFGDKWSFLIVTTLAGGPARFTQLRREISQARPISARILVLTLRHLERNGLITREIFPVVPPRVEYSLTPLGRQFLALGARIVQWASSSRLAFKSAHARFDARLAETNF